MQLIGLFCIAMTDILRQLSEPRSIAGQDRKISDKSRKGYSFLTNETEFVLYLAVLENSVLPMG